VACVRVLMYHLPVGTEQAVSRLILEPRNSTEAVVLTFWKFPVRISDGRSTILTEVILCFPQSLQTMTTSICIFLNSLFTVIQIFDTDGRSRVPFPMRSFDFLIDVILPAALRPCGRLSL
jgi:hypothetical protein